MARVSPITLPTPTPTMDPVTQPTAMANATCQYNRRAVAGSRAVMAAATAGSPEICMAAMRSIVPMGQRLAMLMASNPNLELTSNADTKPAAVEPPDNFTAANANSPLPEKAVTEATITTQPEVPMSTMMALTVTPTAIVAATNATTSTRRSPTGLGGAGAGEEPGEDGDGGIGGEVPTAC